MFMIMVIAFLFFLTVISFIYESLYWTSAGSLAIPLLAFYLLPDFHSFVLNANWFDIITKYVPAYIGAGVATALIKWILLNLKVSSNIQYHREFGKLNFMNKGDTELYAFVKSWNASYSRNRPHLDTNATLDEIITKLTPKAIDYVGRITVWVLEWPVVIVSLILDDVLRKFCTHLASLIDFTFNKLSRKLISNATKGL